MGEARDRQRDKSHHPPQRPTSDERPDPIPPQAGAHAPADLQEALDANAAASAVQHELSAHEAAVKIETLSALVQETERTLKRYEFEFAEQHEAIRLLQQEVDRLHANLAEVQERAAAEPVSVSALDEIAKGIARVTVLTLVGGLVGGPLFALATQSLLGPKIIEAAVGGFVAGVSNELAERAAARTPQLVARRDGWLDDKLDADEESEPDYWSYESESEDQDDDADAH